MPTLNLTKNPRKILSKNLNVHPIASLPKKKRREVLETLTLDQLNFLKKHWAFWARPDQPPPEGDWLIWLLLGGRGAGKTRAGAHNDTALIIPGKSEVLAITGRVLTTLGESHSWKLGVAGGDDRYGNKIGYQKDSTVIGVSSSPVTYYADTPFKLTAVSGQFSSGKIRLKLSAMKFALPEVDSD